MPQTAKERHPDGGRTGPGDDPGPDDAAGSRPDSACPLRQQDRPRIDGDNLFLETAASGPAIDGNPGAEGFGILQQSYLEEANVNAVTELSSLIAAQRAYEMNAKVVTAADQMLSSSTQMMRG